MITRIHTPGPGSRILLSLIVASLFACQGLPEPQSGPDAPLAYPPAPRGTDVDDYYGDTVPDPYRGLEDLSSPRTRQWIEAQNSLARPYLESTPVHPWLVQRLKQLWNYERYGVPVAEGGRYFWLRNDGLQDQSVLYVADGLEGTPRVLLDPNTLRQDGTIALTDFEVSPDGTLIAYALSDGGTDWKTWRVRDVATAADRPDLLQHTKFTDVSWDRDSSGFYYSRYPTDAAGRGDAGKQVSIYYHRLGEAQSADRLVYAVTDHPTRNPYGTLSEDGRFLIIDLFDGYATNGIYYIDLTASQKDRRVVRLLDEWNGLNKFLGSRGEELFFQTTAGAPNGRIVAIDTRHSQPERWREVVPEAPEVIEDARFIGGHFIASYLRDAHAQVRIFDASGHPRYDIPLPGLGKVDGFTGHAADTETFFSYTDYLTPAAIYRYDVASNRLELFRRPRLAADTSRYVTEQVFYSSRDGTRVPMFLTHGRGFARDGSAPLLLYGYGGFNNPQTPTFSAAVLAWLEMGGVYAVANLRGGSEYGEAWHEAGTRLRKQNVFDDYVAAARWLIEQRYTAPGRIAAHGRSNGGLLVGAAITQHPDLFAAALPVVGVLDMLRYHTASANARQWSSDYGLSENEAEYRALRAYSPYHNVREGVCYPPTLLTTADHDDRVVPWHSYKFAAALQSAQACEHPVLIRVETRAGHGAGKPVWMQIEDVANQWAFLARHLHMDVPAAGDAARVAGTDGDAGKGESR